MLGAKHGFAQSMDCATQTMASYFARQSMDCTRNPWIACISKGAKYKFADNLWIALRAQTTDRLVCSQVQSNDKLQVSGIALAS